MQIRFGQVAHLGKVIKVGNSIKMTAIFSYIIQGALELFLNITLNQETIGKQR